MISTDGLLFIEPTSPPSDEPVVDELTRAMATALFLSEPGTGLGDNFRPGSGYRGVHSCSCGARSSNTDHRLADGQVTNSLSPHYLAYHRSEVPLSELEKVRRLPPSNIEPDTSELQPPM